jgi:p-methyltransferase
MASAFIAWNQTQLTRGVEWMSHKKPWDCIIIGYNETPFPHYVRTIHRLGRNSLAYRDLQLSFVTIDDTPMNYMDLLNFVLSSKHDGPRRDWPALRSGSIPNLAAAYLCHYLRARGFRADFINLFQDEKDRLTQYLEEGCLCVAITTTFYTINLPTYEIVEFVRKHNSTTKIVVGGPLIANHLRNFDEDGFRAALKDIGADIFVVDSQGELTLVHLLNNLKNNSPLVDVPNVAYLRNGDLIRTITAPESNSMDDNYVDWTIFPDHHLGSTIQTRTARSCAFNCAFCNYPTRAGKLTLARLETIEHELDTIRKLGTVDNVVFIDDTFNVPLKRFKDICRLIIKNGYSFSWFSYFRCSNADEETFDLMEESGCKGVFLGIESGSEPILQNMNKVATLDKYSAGIAALKKRRIMTFASFIIGFPGETESTVRDTLSFIEATKPHYYRSQLWYCEPGTPIMNQRSKYNIEGQGFAWKHATMNGETAMNHIERMMLSVTASSWLPQWSFDFWAIPSLLGNGLSFEQFNRFMEYANQLLKIEIRRIPQPKKHTLQRDLLNAVIKEEEFSPLPGRDVNARTSRTLAR